MAAHVLTSQGMEVLMLEAGKKLDIEKELKSIEWPYEHPRRGDMPPGHHALALNDTQSASRPMQADSKLPEGPPYVQGWGGTDYSKNIVVDEKEHPYTGTNYAWVRARASAVRRTSGAGLRCACPTTTSRRRAATATARTGRSLTRTSSPTTIASIDTWVSRG